MKSFTRTISLLLCISLLKSIFILSSNPEAQLANDYIPQESKGTVDTITTTQELVNDQTPLVLTQPTILINPQTENVHNDEPKVENQVVDQSDTKNKREELIHIVEELKNLEKAIENDILIIDINNQMFNSDIQKVDVVANPVHNTDMPILLIGTNNDQMPQTNAVQAPIVTTVEVQQENAKTLSDQMARLLEVENQANIVAQQPPQEKLIVVQDTIIPPEAIEAISLLSPEELKIMEKKVEELLANIDNLNHLNGLIQGQNTEHTTTTVTQEVTPELIVENHMVGMLNPFDLKALNAPNNSSTPSTQAA